MMNLLNPFAYNWFEICNLQSILVCMWKINVLSCIFSNIYKIGNFVNCSSILTTRPSSFFLKFSEHVFSDLRTHSYCQLNSKYVRPKNRSIRTLLAHFIPLSIFGATHFGSPRQLGVNWSSYVIFFRNLTLYLQ